MSDEEKETVKAEEPKQLRRGAETYPVLAPKTDIQLMVALSQVLEYFKSSQKEADVPDELISKQASLAVGWFAAKVNL